MKDSRTLILAGIGLLLIATPVLAGPEETAEAKIGRARAVVLTPEASREAITKGLIEALDASLQILPKTDYAEEFKARIETVKKMFADGALLEDKARQYLGLAYKMAAGGKAWQVPDELKSAYLEADIMDRAEEDLRRAPRFGPGRPAGRPRRGGHPRPHLVRHLCHHPCRGLSGRLAAEVRRGVVPGPGFDSAPALGYIVPERADEVENREFDYDSLVRPMEPRMMRAIWRIVRQKEAAEDALQDALAAIWKKRDAVARHPNPQALILRISVAAAIDAVRKSARRLRHETPGLPDDRTDDTAPPVTKGAEDRDLRAAILEAIGELPRRQAAAVLLHIVEEQPYEEISRAMGCSETTVRVHVLRGRAKLARLLARKRPDLAGGLNRAGKEATS